MKLLVALCLAAASASLGAQVAWNDTVLAPPGRVLCAEICELTEASRKELVVGLWNRELQRRELRVHSVENNRLVAEPRLVIPILEDIVAWGVAELDSNSPGPELLLLTPNSAWSYLLKPGGYASNAHKLFDHPLLYDLPDRNSLPRWRYVVPFPSGDQLLLPSPTGYSTWAPNPNDVEGGWSETARFDLSTGTGDDNAARSSMKMGDKGIVLSASARAGLDIGQEFDGWLSTPLLSVNRAFRAPGLVDLNADGQLDIARLAERNMSVHLGSPAGFRALADSRRALPEFLYDGKFESRDTLLRDIDNDGDSDLLVLLEGETLGLFDKNRKLTLAVISNTGAGELNQKPQLLRFQGVSFSAEISKVDGDEHPDLVVDVFVAPDLGALTSPDELNATLRVSVFKGLGNGRFNKSPFVRYEHVLSATNFDQAVQHREINGDLTGDGLADLVTVDILGRVGIHPLKQASSLFGGSSWKLSTTPATQLSTSSERGQLQLADLNNDGLTDLISAHESRVFIYISQRSGASR